MELTVDIRSVWKQVKGVMLTPKKFFKSASKEKSWKKALSFVVVTAAFGHVFTAIYGVVFSPSVSEEFAKSFGITESSFRPEEVIPAVIISFVLTIGMSLIWGGALKLWLMIFKVDSTFAQAYRVMSYSRAPNYLLSWIPFLNLFVAIYSFYLLGVALMTEYSISRKKAVLVILTSILALAAISLVLVSLVTFNM